MNGYTLPAKHEKDDQESTMEMVLSPFAAPEHDSRSPSLSGSSPVLADAF